MAKLILENVIVDRVFSTQHGYGVGVTETFEMRNGETGRKRYTLWFNDHPGVEEGQRISASGFLGTKVREYESNGETRTAVDVSVYSARLIQSAPPIDPAPETDSWTPQATGDAWSTPQSSDTWGGEF
ncbi:hypothetical protein [Microbacterium sp. XT11]|uniref:hypothetical protein n=1 Tax=Microbacterium sp. XT11 TaxID=367477 RepID=UPI00082F3B79|nr:hypothetical protein [Microbacterium sp. XT11]